MGNIERKRAKGCVCVCVWVFDVMRWFWCRSRRWWCSPWLNCARCLIQSTLKARWDHCTTTINVVLLCNHMCVCVCVYCRTIPTLRSSWWANWYWQWSICSGWCTWCVARVPSHAPFHCWACAFVSLRWYAVVAHSRRHSRAHRRSFSSPRTVYIDRGVDYGVGHCVWRLWSHHCCVWLSNGLARLFGTVTHKLFLFFVHLVIYY